jgi:hypothetical protein
MEMGIQTHGYFGVYFHPFIVIPKDLPQDPLQKEKVDWLGAVTNPA